MNKSELLIAQRAARRTWPAIGAKTKVTVIPQPVKRTRPLLPNTAVKEHTVEIHRFLILPQTHILMGYSDEFDELVIIDERPCALEIRQGLLQVVDALEKGTSLHISPTTSDLRRERKLAAG